jgi:hypothetical protein
MSTMNTLEFCSLKYQLTNLKLILNKEFDCLIYRVLHFILSTDILPKIKSFTHIWLLSFCLQAFGYCHFVYRHLVTVILSIDIWLLSFYLQAFGYCHFALINLIKRHFGYRHFVYRHFVYRHFV